MNSVYNRLSVESRADGVILITFTAPARLNAVTRQTLESLLAALDTPGEAIVLTGQGRAFSAGQDLAELADLGGRPDWDVQGHLALYQRVTERLLAEPRPTVAAVNGVAVGFGAEVALACDVRIAGDSARMGFVEVARGLFQTNGVTWLLPRLVGHGRATDLLLSGDIIEADTLERWGLVTRRSTDGTLLADAIALASSLAGGNPLSRQLVRSALARTWQATLQEMMTLEVDGMTHCIASGDAAEGAQRFVTAGRS